jgi:hypothetical protein
MKKVKYMLELQEKKTVSASELFEGNDSKIED